MIAVRLLRAYGPVNAGEIAGYPAEQVGPMIAEGIAEIYDPEPEATEVVWPDVAEAVEPKRKPKA